MIDYNQKYFNYLEKMDQTARKTMVPLDLEGDKFVIKDRKKYINFSSNDYLALRTNPILKKNAIMLIEEYGVGLGGSRLIAGNLHLIELLEKKIAKWKQAEAALIMSSGYQLNSSVLPAIFNDDVFSHKPTVILDKNVHASIYDGCNKSKICLLRFRHNDLDHLEKILANTKIHGAKFVITESLFSMNGTIPNLKEIGRICSDNNAFLIVDEAHAIGVFGQNGNGLVSNADMTIGTFGKAFGSHGAFLTCSQKMKDYLIATCKGLIYSTAPSPANIGSILGALDLVPKMRESREKILFLAEHFKDKLVKLNLNILSEDSHIVSISMKDAPTAYGYQKFLRNSGFWVKAIFPPTVTKKNTCIRFSICAFHDLEDINSLISSLASVPIDNA